MVLIAMALEYAPYNFEIIAAWIWLGFMLIYLVFFPFQRCLVLYKFADIGIWSGLFRYACDEHRPDHLGARRSGAPPHLIYQHL